MTDNDEVKVLIVDGSVVESTTLMILLSPLTKNLTCCLNYSRGLAALENAVNHNDPFDLVLLALPTAEHPEYDISIKLFATSLQNGDPLRTIILGGDKLPVDFKKTLDDEQNTLSKPITREKLADVLAPLGLILPKLNCWQYLRCGREPGGERCDDLGICPTAVENAANGLHGGDKGGRSCWAISGTLCGGVVQGSFCSKIANCMDCDFYKLVQSEEGERFESIDSILNRLKRKRG